MSFYSDKDFRKGAGVPSSKKTTSTDKAKGEVVNKGVNVVERARNEREVRAKSREETIRAIKIQCWWRGRSSATKTITAIRTECDRKLSDISNLSAMLLNKGNVVFIPPVPICIELVKKITIFGFHGLEDTRRIIRLCSYVLLPTLSQMDPSKNIAKAVCDENNALVNRLSNSILHLCSPKIMKKLIVNEEQVTNILLPCLRLLVGGGEPFRMVYAYELGAAFSRIRASLTRNNLFRRIRGLLTVRSDSLVTSIDSDESTTVIRRPLSGAAADILVSICMFVVTADRNEMELTRDRNKLFAAEILTVPMVTLLLSEEAMASLAGWEGLERILDLVSVPPLRLPPSPHAVFQSEQWMSGNLASMFPYFNINRDFSSAGRSNEAARTGGSGSGVRANVTDTLLESYMLLLVFFYCRHAVPGVLQGRKGIVWNIEGSAMTAASVPCGLKLQLLCPLAPSVCDALNNRILGAVQGGKPGGKGSHADREGVAAALASSGLIMSQSSLSEGQQAQQWFSSKWALKLMGKVAAKSGLNMDLTLLSPASQLEVERINGTKIAVCQFEENYRLVGALGRLWAVLLPHAIFSPMGDQSGGGQGGGAGGVVIENKAWKALSLLSFGSNAADRLWIAVEHPGMFGSTSAHTKRESTKDNQSTAIVNSESGKKKESKSQSSSFGGFMSMFGFSSGTSSSKGSDSGGANPNNDIGITEGCRNDSPLTQISISSSGAVDIEEYAARTFYPSLHLSPEGPDCRLPALVAFATILKTSLTATDDYEFYTLQKPLPLVQYVRIVRTFKTILYRILKSDPSLAQEPSSSAAEKGDKLYSFRCLRFISGVLSDLYLRWARRPFSAATVWVIDDPDTDIRSEIRASSPFAAALLREMPWSLDYFERMRIFREVVDDEKRAIQGQDMRSPSEVRVRVRRTHMLLDGMAAFEKAGSAVKGKMVVKYINSCGDEESGIDIGGLFKDFLSDLSSRVFDPSYGLFCATSDNLLYPNPAAILLYPEPGELEALYCFLGRVLGKALFENITVQPQFAHFFLAFMHGRYNFMNLVHDLATLDPGLYKNLMFLKTYAGDIEDLSLTFSVTETDMGTQRDRDLVLGGSKIAVTSKNRHRYISAIAKYHLYDRLKKQAKAFFGGMYQVIKPDLFTIFCAPELQILISGLSALSLKDLKPYTRYQGYTAYDRNVQRLWSVLEELNAADSGLFLKFVTSCERPPSLGFASLQPPFTVQLAESADQLRLPTASTCFNTLKLPPYSSREVLKERLLTSIRSGAGFDLS